MNDPAQSHQALNRAMLEAVDFVHAEGWDAQPTLFGLVPSRLLADQVADVEEDPLTLVVQEGLPEGITPGSGELLDYLGRIAWPGEVAGAVLAQEIVFRDSSAGAESETYRARLFSGVLRSGAELTLLQRRPTEAELADRGPFAEDEIDLRGGPGVAPGVIALLRQGLEQDPTFGEG